MADKAPKARGLGRGLSALMADVQVGNSEPGDVAVQRSDITVPIDHVSPNPNQPRRHFDEDELAELSASIADKGILQPIIVRPSSDERYEIVAGERRWRAAQMAQLHDVPVLVRDFTDPEMLEVAIIENVQRADLNAVEEAMGYRQLMDNYGRTQSEVAKALGKSRSHIANSVRLLTLPGDVQEMVRDGRLSAGHARALVTTDAASDLAAKIVSQGLSVRDTEDLARKSNQPDAAPAAPKPALEKDADTKALEGDLSANLGMPVTLSHKPGQESGHLMIRYKTLDELDTLCRLLSGI